MQWVIDTECTIFQKGNPFAKKNHCCLIIAYCIDTDTYHHWWPEEFDKARDTLQSATSVVMFNAKFDLHWLRRVLGLTFSKVWDCQLFHYFKSYQKERFPSLDGCLDIYKLERKLDIVKEKYWDVGIDTDSIPRDVLLEYGLWDVNRTFSLYNLQRQELHSWIRLFNLHCADLLVLAEMEWNGLWLDIAQCAKEAMECKARIEEIEQTLRKGYEHFPVNFDSTDHLSAYLYGGTIVLEKRIPVGVYGPKAQKAGQVRYGILKDHFELPRQFEPLKGSELKKEGLFGTSEEILKQLKGSRDQKRIISLILERSKLQKLVSTYFEGFPKFNHEYDWPENKIHGQYNQCVVATGRLSSSKPNLQNVAPELKTHIKSQLGMLVNIDAKALEWCGAAVLSGDPLAISEITEGLDVHGLNQAAFGLPERVIAKIFLFRLIYGGTEFSYARDPDFTGVSASPRFWKRVIDKTYDKYKGLAGWHTRLVQQVTRTWQWVSPFGRVYKYFMYEGKFPRTIVLNYPVQGFGADILALYRVLLSKELTKSGLCVKLLSTVHDSVVADCSVEDAPKFAQLAFEVARTIPQKLKQYFGIDYTVPFRVEIGMGPNYKDLKEIKEHAY